MKLENSSSCAKMHFDKDNISEIEINTICKRKWNSNSVETGMHFGEHDYVDA